MTNDNVKLRRIIVATTFLTCLLAPCVRPGLDEAEALISVPPRLPLSGMAVWRLGVAMVEW